MKQAQEMHTQAKKLSDVNPSLSFQLLEQCIAIYTQINYQNYEVLADCYLGMSTIQNEFRNTTKVLDYAYKALAICNNIKSEKLPVFKHDIYLQLAEGQIMNQNFDEAIHFTLKAYSLLDELADKEETTQEVYVKLGFCYGLKGLAQESTKHLSKKDVSTIILHRRIIGLKTIKKLFFTARLACQPYWHYMANTIPIPHIAMAI